MGKRYDYIVIGSGPAGHVSAIRASKNGLKTLVIEKDEAMFGGVCLNEGCIPAKSLYNSARIISLFRKNAGLFRGSPGAPDIDITGIAAKSRKARDTLRGGLEFVFKKNGIDIVYGQGKFADESTIVIEDALGSISRVRGDKFLIATGSSPKTLNTARFDGTGIISSSEAIRLEEIPGRLLIVGGGAIGIEFASYFNILGSEVTLVEMEERILPGEDADISKRMMSVLKQRGVKVMTGCVLDSVDPVDDGIKTVIAGGAPGIFDKVLVATGRVPASRGLGLDAAGVKTDKDGFIIVDSSLSAGTGDIYAAGDVIKTPMLAHVGYIEGETAAIAAGGGKPGPIDYKCVPNAVYSDIRTASVGVTEEEMMSAKTGYVVGKQFFKANGRAVVEEETQGFIKIIADSSTYRLLGAHIIGFNADEMIHEFVVALKNGLTARNIAETVHAHPTFSETAVDACRSVYEKPIHG